MNNPISKISVQNMNSPKSGHPVANQFIIQTEEGKYFQSYWTIIAFIDLTGHVTLDSEDWNYSRTTGKYRNIFLGENTAETRKKINNGTYSTAPLN